MQAFSNTATALHTINRFEMESRNLNDFTIPLSSDDAYILMNSAMILRKNAEVQAEYTRVQKQIDELIQTRAKLEETKKAYAAMVEKLPPHRRHT